jgi:uncharacterized protein YxjI
MDINNKQAERAYRVKNGGSNFIIVDEIYIYEDNIGKSFVLQQNILRKRLYTLNEHKTILSEKEGFYDYQAEKEVVLKLICSRYRLYHDYILFYYADREKGEIMTKEEIMGDDILSEIYKCNPWSITNLYYEK